MRLLVPLTIVLVTGLAGCVPSGGSRVNPAVQPPAAPREFRAVWVATVANIDWPSKPGLASDEQKREAIAILDRAHELNLNAIVLQVRPAADALYKSRYEPWSYYLSGKQGRPPEPYYDPLKFWVIESHKRGLELHAWFNPYRARHSGAPDDLSPKHVSKRKPHIVREFNKWQWLDPAEPEAQDETFNVFMDVVKRYDVDGIHIDDYFYPYPEYLKNADFPDEARWQRYQESGGRLSRADWRRENVNRLIQRIYEGSHKIRKDIKFGISPFGLARPGHPPVAKGFDQFEKLYADTERWLREGWCDYWTPQLYWKISATSQPYVGLLEYWVSINEKQRHIWPGLFTGKVGDSEKSWEVKEIIDQIEATRNTPGASGEVHFSMKVFMKNREGIVDALESGPYREPALVPASPWLDDAPPAPPIVRVRRDRKDGAIHLTWSRRWFTQRPWQYAVFARYGETWKFLVFPATGASGAKLDPGASVIAVSAVDRSGNESERVIIESFPR